MNKPENTEVFEILEQMEMKLTTEESLAEKFSLESKGNSDEASMDLSTAIALPVALCDDKLIEEIRQIPEKMGFKIGEVADMLGIKQYVLRYWETEFDVLKPKKAANNQRYYTKKDVENAFLIRKLLHRDRFSIEGARSAMKSLKTHVRSEVKKERSFEQLSNKIESLQDRVDIFTMEIRRLKNMFR